MAFGLLVGLISMCTSGPACIISAFAMVLLIKISFDNWDLIGGADGLSLLLIQLRIKWEKLPFYYGMLIIGTGTETFCVAQIWIGTTGEQIKKD